ncbi:MAG: hypothetical protein ACRC92_26870 [Peptostreptococcaceae bacterium]
MYLKTINDNNKLITRFVQKDDTFRTLISVSIKEVEEHVMCSSYNGLVVGEKLKTMGDIFINRTFNLKFIKLREELTELNNALLETISKVNLSGDLICSKDVFKNIEDEVVDVLIVSAHILYLFKNQYRPANIHGDDTALFLESLTDVIINNLMDNESSLFDSLGVLPHALNESYFSGASLLYNTLDRYSKYGYEEDSTDAMNILKHKLWSKIKEYDCK